MLDICAKNEVDPTIGLGEVQPQTHRQTDRHTDRRPTAINSIDCFIFFSACSIFFFLFLGTNPSNTLASIEGREGGPILLSKSRHILFLYRRAQPANPLVAAMAYL